MATSNIHHGAISSFEDSLIGAHLSNNFFYLIAKIIYLSLLHTASSCHLNPGELLGMRCGHYMKACLRGDKRYFNPCLQKD